MDILGFVKNWFSNLLDEPRKRRATEDIDLYSSPKYRRISLGMSKGVEKDGFGSTSRRIPSPHRLSGTKLSGTIVIDDDPGTKPFKSKFTSTPTDPQQRVNIFDDDVTFIKSIKSSADKRDSARAAGLEYIRPFAAAPKAKRSLNNSDSKELPSVFGSSFKSMNGTGPNSSKRMSSSGFSTSRLDEKRDYQNLIEQLSGGSNSSMYATPMARMSRYDSSSGFRSRKMLELLQGSNTASSTPKPRQIGFNKKPFTIDLTTESSSSRSASLKSLNGHAAPKISIKDTIKQVLGKYENNVVEIQDSESDSLEILPNPPSPKPDIKVTPINSLKTLYDTNKSTHKGWMDELIKNHQQRLDDRSKVIQGLQENTRQINQINHDIRVGSLASKVKSSLTIKDQVLPIEEEKDEPLPDIEEYQHVLDRAKYGPPGEVLVKKFNLNIARKDIKTLDKLNWLNDEIINFYMNLIIERSQNNQKFPKTYAFNTFFYQKLCRDGAQSLRRWTKRVDIFAHDIICIPIHVQNVHWCMAIINLKEPSIRYYDSMGSSNNSCLEGLRRWLEAEHQDKKGSPLNTNDFILENMKDIPQQMNGSDCGVFSCTFAEFISRGAKLTFTQDNMKYMRNKMIIEIINGHLLIH